MCFKLYRVFPVLLAVILGVAGCKKWVEVDPPVTNPISSTIFQNNATATAALSGIYNRMMEGNKFSGGGNSLGVLTGLSSDELKLVTTTATHTPYYRNSLLSSNILNTLWNEPYQYIYSANAAIEGLTGTNGVSTDVKRQLIGEAKFIRAFFYFYLVNLYGDVPLITTTDYRGNKLAGRTPKADVYKKVLDDLYEAQELLGENFLNADAKTISNERVRPTKWAATALLARVHLYTKNWSGADSAATAVLNNSINFDTVPVNNVFIKNSKETIWQLMPVVTGYNTLDGDFFILTATPNSSRPVTLSSQLLSAFEPGDKRYTNWTGSFGSYRFPYKYKVRGGTNNTVTEYQMVLRLAEQYLIRAEAKAEQNMLTEARADINVLRSRAGLLNTTANDKTSLLSAILQERQVELFSEWGHRWFDLKRTNSADAVMSLITPQKGGTWSTDWQLYPIPLADLQVNPNLTQNPGYN